MIRRSKMKFVKTIWALAAGAMMYAPKGEAQAIPVPIAAAPFAGLVATGCSTSIPLYTQPGTTAENVGDGCPATDASFSGIGGIAIDSYGNVFIADNSHDEIRVIYEGGAALAQAIVTAQPAGGTLTTINIQKGYIYTIVGSYSSGATPVAPYTCSQVAGATLVPNPSTVTLNGCPGGYVFVLPRAIAVDADGNVFYDSIGGRQSVQVFYVGGTKAANLIELVNSKNPTPITTVTPGYAYLLAGTTSSGYGGNGINAISTGVELDSPRDIYVDANENVIFADMFNSVVREISSTTGFINTIAGTCVLSGVSCESATQRGLPDNYGDGGPATSAAFNWAYAVTEDAYGNLFIGDTGAYSAGTAPLTPPYGRVRVVYAGGTLPGITSPVVGNIYTYAGAGSLITSNNPALQVQFDAVTGLSIDASGYLYVSERRFDTTTSNHIWRIDPVTGIATIIAGTGGAGLSTATPPAFLYCSTGSGTTGNGPTHTDKYGSGCPAPQAPISSPVGNYDFDKQGNAYVADNGYAMIRQFLATNVFPATPVGTASAAQYLAFDVPTGTVTTGLGFTVEGTTSTEYADVGATTDTCTLPKTFTADTICAFDVKFTPAKTGLRAGAIQVNNGTTAQGTEFLSGVGTGGVLTIDPGTTGTLGSGITPEGVAVDELGNAYLSDGKGNQVLKIPTAGGTATPIVTGLNGPRQVAVDGQGTVYVADSGNNRIVRQPVTGAATYLGTGLKSPQGVAVDYDGNVYVADTGNARVVELGAITGIQNILNVDVTTLVSPSSLTIDSAGNLYIVDTGSGAKHVVELPAAGGQKVLSLTASSAPVAYSIDLAGDVFVADSTLEEVIEIPASGASTIVMLSSLTNPVGLANDASGSLYLADSGNTSVTSLNRTVGSLVFPQTDIKQTTFPTLPMTLSSAGNLTDTLATPLFTDTNATVFPVAGATTNPCSAGEPLAPTATCQETATFHPLVTGAQSAIVTYTSSGNTVIANLSGNAVNLVLTTTTVTQTSTPLSPVPVGTSVTVLATVTPTGTETGTLTYTVDTVVQKPSVALGTSLTMPSLAIGTHTITACYSGDSVYGASCGSITIVVSKITTTIKETVTQGNGGPSVSAAITPTTQSGFTATGTITFTVNGTAGTAQPYATASIGPLVLPDGSNTICATYSGDTNFATSTICTTLTIAKTVTTVTEIETQASGGPIVSATVSPLTANGLSLTGTITFTVDGGAGTTYPFNAATLGPENLANGSHTVCAKYNGDGNFEPSTNCITFTISKVGTSITLLVTTVTGGDQFQIVFTSAGVFTPAGYATIAPTGTLAIYLAGVNVKNNTIVPVLTTLNGATYYTYTYTSSPLTTTGTDNPAATLTATYSGDGNYANTAITPTTLAVYHEPTTTAVTVVRGAGGSVVSGTITPAAGAYPDLPGTTQPFVPLVSGTVTIYRDGVTDGTLTLTSANPAVFSYTDTTAADGSHTFYAIYGGDGNYKTSTSNTGSITVLHAPTTTTLAVSGGGAAGIPAIQLTATTTSTTAGIIAGTTNFYNSGVLIGSAPVVNGVAVFDTPTLVYSSYTFCSTYEGDGNYLASTSPCVTEGLDLAIAPTTATTFSVAYQAQYPMTFVLASIEGYSGTLKPSCSGLPANTLCRFDNYSLVVGPGTNAVSNLQLYAGINPGTASVRTGGRSMWLASIFGWPVGIALLLILRRRGLRKRMPVLLSLVMLLAFSAGLCGCGSGAAYNPIFITPAGTDSITVTYTDVNNFSRSVVLTVTFEAGP